MNTFMSTVQSKIDAKGRVSVPSVFRAVIAAQNGARKKANPPGIFVYPSFTEKAIEGGGKILLDNLDSMVGQLNSYSEEHDALAASLFGDSHHLAFDADGRVSLPAALLAHAGIEKTLCFVGLGSKFQIWNPDNFGEFRTRARKAALMNRDLLGANGDDK